MKRNPEKVRRKYRKKKPNGLKTKNGSKRKRKPRKSGIRKRFENMNKVYKDLWKEVGTILYSDICLYVSLIIYSSKYILDKKNMYLKFKINF